MKLFVEGGGDSNQLKSACREAFSKFITKAGINKRPRIVACGSRNSAYERFCSEIENDKPAILLVDSEMAVLTESQADNLSLADWQAWLHLRGSDGWQQPSKASDQQCHLVVECMENWFLADRATLKQFFGQHFQENVLPSIERPIEAISKDEVYRCLKNASRSSDKGVYQKGEHSFKLLALIDPQLAVAASAWAKRFIMVLKSTMEVQ